ncbi:lysozyme inhibitor LprI family protein [uncultured Helicobacter sp.]|uniref:lysozyme inhibitor LprI family protein n=1 Tax=uncultured Helicobacter sp. TaxID=175537 RepID=UPI00374EBC11
MEKVLCIFLLLMGISLKAMQSTEYIVQCKKCVIATTLSEVEMERLRDGEAENIPKDALIEQEITAYEVSMELYAKELGIPVISVDSKSFHTLRFPADSHKGALQIPITGFGFYLYQEGKSPLKIAKDITQSDFKAYFSNDTLTQWRDIEEFKHTDMHFSGYTDIGGHSPINFNTYIIKIVGNEAREAKDSIPLTFELERVISGGNRIRSWGNKKGGCSDDGDTTKHKALYPTILLKPSSEREARLVFPDFKGCVLEVTRLDSNTLRIEGLENPKCSFLQQKCFFDVGEEVYIAREYRKIEAGFDCAKAQSASERAICANADLAYLDREVNVLYEALRKNAKDIAKAMGDSSDKAVLDSQRAYLKQRNTCWNDTQCLQKTMQERIEAIVKELAEYQ